MIAFLAEMNKCCALLGLKASMFDSPHGLMNQQSKSTAYDIAKLSAICMNDKRFCEIVNTKLYTVEKKGKNGKVYRWENTHKLIGQKGVTPIKTGITTSAGPCLATAVDFDPSAQLIIVILCSKDMDCRWPETIKLAKWATDRVLKIKQFKLTAEPGEQ